MTSDPDGGGGSGGGVVVVTTTYDDEAKARALAGAVVRERLAACAQVYPVRSVFRWDGEVRDCAEWRVDFKTRAELFERLAAFIGGRHGYDVPEVVAVPVAAGSADYLAWVVGETTG
ncbi:divalent-cation tolerance protein CutA [Kitasatospora sp. NPDC088346]|uniref:divalent-cation tolerance protein CutA n=1 Tax=Kitasatospora sp. NPDC088346 TaxID=3364073 RepID=UPI00382A9A0F